MLRVFIYHLNLEPDFKGFDLTRIGFDKEFNYNFCCCCQWPHHNQFTERIDTTKQKMANPAPR